MKKVLSIFLILMMLVANVHPTVAMHFCGGIFREMSIQRTVKSCCGKPMDSAKQSDFSKVTNVRSNCCSTHQIKVITGDYQQSQPTDAHTTLPSFDNVWVVLYNAFTIASSDNSLLLKYLFPPDGLQLQNLDTLSFICTYRI